jgi:hypothetical protein
MMIFEAEKRIAQAEEEFKSLCEYVTGEAQDQDAYTVEKRVFKEVLRMALSLMAAYSDCGQHTLTAIGTPIGTIICNARNSGASRTVNGARHLLNMPLHNSVREWPRPNCFSGECAL